ncbi:hypothetical protein Pla123a_44040 [Posidoniimonas polymericola]|uniref:Uncharacterized protein n=1 Tax=Posidoniimonas polymericola TaxID=2528002 RepID=A0A5C5XYG3_9BACT|nr:hypothetical protein Pla123a_44040 [Posidoniimonas polymericola]
MSRSATRRNRPNTRRPTCVSRQLNINSSVLSLVGCLRAPGMGDRTRVEGLKRLL